MSAQKVFNRYFGVADRRSGTIGPPVPDTTPRQPHAQEVVAYDAWFRNQVEQALVEAESADADWVSPEELKQMTSESGLPGRPARE